MNIPYVNLKKQYKIERKNILKIIDNALISGNWVGGDEIKKFEINISKICKTKYAVALNSGTDALTLSLHLLGVRKGDEVITTCHTASATVSAILNVGAKPVLIEVDENNYNINYKFINFIFYYYI